MALLSTAERQACERLRGTARKARYACAHALLRCQLGAVLEQTPRAVEIEAGPRRRPQLTGGSAARRRILDFNLSSTDGLVACALASGSSTGPGDSGASDSQARLVLRVGFDLEAPQRNVDTEALYNMVLSAAEIRWLDRLQQNARMGFYQLWTLKEAIAKADGEGLGLPLNRLTVLPDGQGGLSLDLRAMGENETHWLVYLLDAGVPAALALRTGPRQAALQPAVDFNLPLPEGFRPQQVRLKARQPRQGSAEDRWDTPEA